ncbi:MAG TPA: hypothetical protein VGP68_06850, partial [Gemmataceae bacterium]|nr:hypothetical protein [Gemmataceae bacterium]
AEIGVQVSRHLLILSIGRWLGGRFDVKLRLKFYELLPQILDAAFELLQLGIEPTTSLFGPAAVGFDADAEIDQRRSLLLQGLQVSLESAAFFGRLGFLRGHSIPKRLQGSSFFLVFGRVAFKSVRTGVEPGLTLLQGSLSGQVLSVPATS